MFTCYILKKSKYYSLAGIVYLEKQKRYFTNHLRVARMVVLSSNRSGHSQASKIFLANDGFIKKKKFVLYKPAR
jgi:hypothetical protein